ncbi:Asp23/Gls24 family envelope stress response protein [Streptomyces sp. ODS28]|uniref:Asp23/Gls24 family envelope stress response protein n=1 Tax=Streptomyces sp. ODS28 TaxID=3136688 RepID=UPI0031EECB91
MNGAEGAPSGGATAVADGARDGARGAPEGTGGTEAAERGSTRIADRVLAKIAAQAAREALRAERGTGPPAPLRGRQGPRATVSVQGEKARVRVVVELGYPSDIGAQCAAVRRQVAARVGELAGTEVREVAVEVERLHSPYLGGEALGRVR